MIGRYQIQLGAEQLTSGMSSSDYATDGALGVSCNGLNPYLTPGVMYALAAPTSISTNVADSIIASCEDAATIFGNNRYMVGDGGNYYSFNGTTVTKQVTGAATTKYIAGRTDISPWAGKFYATITDNLCQWNGTGTLNEAFQSFNDSAVPHPLQVYQSNLYVGDGNTIGVVDSTNTYTGAALTLGNPKERVWALGIDPVTGLMMISIQTTTDISDTIPSLKAVYLWDGISAKPTRKILVDDLITAFYNVEGVVYVGSGQTLGVWNGNGVTFLRKLQNVALFNTDLLYKHHFANINRILHVVDGKQILSYGTVIAGKPKAFFYTASTQTNNHASAIFPVGSNKLAVASATNNLQSFDFSSATAGTAQLFFNNIYFPRPVFIRRVRVITTDVTTTLGIGNVVLTDEKQNGYQPNQSGNVGFITATGGYVFDFDFSSAKMMGCQLYFGMDTQHFGIVRVYIYYDVGE